MSALSSQRVEMCHFDSSIVTFFRYMYKEGPDFGFLAAILR